MIKLWKVWRQKWWTRALTWIKKTVKIFWHNTYLGAIFSHQTVKEWRRGLAEAAYEYSRCAFAICKRIQDLAYEMEAFADRLLR